MGFFCLIERFPSFVISGLNYALLWPVVGRRGKGRDLGESGEREKKKKNIKILKKPKKTRETK